MRPESTEVDRDEVEKKCREAECVPKKVLKDQSHVQGAVNVTRFHFREVPLDIYLLLLYALATLTSFLALNVSGPLPLGAILIIPGYAWTAFLFPRNNDLDWAERMVLSFGLGAMTVWLIHELVGLVLRIAPFTATLVSVETFAWIAGIAGYFRRTSLPVHERLTCSLALPLHEFLTKRPVDKGLTIAMVALIVVAFVVVGFSISRSGKGTPFTEFFVLGPGGNASGYPKVLNVSQQGTLIIGLVNHESETINYTIRVDLAMIKIVYNSTTGTNESIETNRTTLPWINATLGDGERWARTYSFQINSKGNWKVHFSLYKNDVLTIQRLDLSVLVD